MLSKVMRLFLVILVRVVFLRGVIRAVHVAVFFRANCWVELRHAAKVLDADLLDAAGVLVLHDFAAAPFLLDGASDGRVDGDRVSLNIDHHAVPVDIERRASGSAEYSPFMPIASIQS